MYEIGLYVNDLDWEGLDAHVVILNSSLSPLAVRSMIGTEISKRAVGCLLVGGPPTAWYEMNNPSPWGNEHFPTDLFYMDLDGTWTDTNDNGLYDQHSGNQAREIWVGRLKASGMFVDEVTLVRKYFAKNHAYRTGSLSLPNRALIYIDDDWQGMASEGNSSVGKVFGERELVSDLATTIASDYLTRLNEGYSFVHVMVHGSSNCHAFKPSTPDSYIRSTDVFSADPKAFFYLLFSCSNARYTETNYIAGSYVFSSTYSLAAVSSTKTGAKFPTTLNTERIVFTESIYSAMLVVMTLP